MALNSGCFLLRYILLTTFVAGQRLETFSSSHGRVSKIVLDPAGNIFVGGRNAIYQFADESVSAENLEVFLDTRQLQARHPALSETNAELDKKNDVSILMIYEHNAIPATQRLLLACGTVGYGMCNVFDVRNISSNWPIIPPDNNDVEAALGSKTSALVVQAPGNYFFSAINDVGMNMTNTTFTFSVRTFFQNEQSEYILHYERTYVPENFYITTRPGTDFRFLHGQYYNCHIYVVRNTIEDHMSEAYMSQMCAPDIYFRSYMESKIHCGEYVVAEAATVFNHSENTYLVTTFSSRLHPGSALCVFNISNIENHFRNARKDCFKQKIGQWPDWIEQRGSSCDVVENRTKFDCGYTEKNRRIATSTVIEAKPVYINSTGLMTSLAMTAVDDTPIGYIGHADGTITKMMFDSKMTTNHMIYTVTVTDDQPIDPGMEINDNGEKLFFTHSNKVSMLMTEDCNLIQSCSNCLAVSLPCVWIGFCVHSSALVNRPNHDIEIYSDFCPPEIYSVSPLSGPLQGGTNITVTGNFGTAGNKLTIFVGDVSRDFVLQEVAGSFNVTTRAVSGGFDQANITVTVIPGTNNNQQYTWDTPINGSVQFPIPFEYKKSILDRREEYYVKHSGNIKINMTGTNLNIGGNRRFEVGQLPCINESYAETSLSCRAPAQASQGNFTSTLYIDNQITQGPNIMYLPDPVITNVSPKSIIRSGGILVTFNGTYLGGLGSLAYIVSSINHTLGAPGSQPCDIKMESMECIMPEYSGLMTPSPILLYNEYGPFDIAFEPPSLGMLTIVEDPTVEDIGDLTLQNGKIIEMKGKHFNNVDPRYIHVMIGATPCHLESLTDTLITCKVGQVEDDLLLLPVEVHFGSALVRRVGNAVYGLPVAQTSTTSVEDMGLKKVAIIVVVLAGILIIAIGAAFIFRRMRTKLRTMNGESYNVIFTRDREALAVADLSERDTADAAQNRQNVYQEQTFMKAAEENAGKDVEPLLPSFDEDVRVSLERQNLLVDRNHLMLGEVIGQGHFGCVYKGYLQKPDEKEETIVAAKTLHRSNPKDMDIEQFLKEALIMKDFHHRNVMELIGICLGLKKLPLVVLPFMRRGDLLTYIRDVNNVPTVKKLVEFGIDIANGMHYLSQLKFVHRDLAARNCMIDEDYVVKVADFGLSRDVYEKEYYSTCDKKTMLPVKWMSPESLEIGMFNYKTDIWSFGVVLWELLTRGMVPYPTVDNWDMLRFLKSGRRMPKPDYCPEGMYRIMQRCWAWTPEERPSFGELTIEIPQLLRRLERSSSERSRSTTTDESSDRSSSRAASECK